jgi:hypothetical protein
VGAACVLSGGDEDCGFVSPVKRGGPESGRDRAENVFGGGN